MKRHWFVLIILALVAVSSVGVMAQDTVNLNFWHTIPAATETYLDEELLPPFEEANPECKVVLRNLGNESTDSPTLIRTGLAASGDDRPDMVWIASYEHGAYTRAGVLADVQGFFDEHPDLLADIYPSLVELSSFEGEIRSVPMMTNNVAMLINVDAFEEAGLEIPSQDPEETWTWEEFYDAAAALTTEGRKGFLFPVGPGGWQGWIFHALLKQADPNAAFISEDGTATFNSEAGVEAIDFLKRLVDDNLVAFSEAGRGSDLTPWYAGNVAMIINGPWNQPGLKEFNDFEFTVVPLPRNEVPAAPLGGNQLFIFKSTPEEEACAWKFAQYILSTDFQIAFNIQSGNLPVTQSAFESDEYQEFVAETPYLAGWLNQTPYGVARSALPAFTTVNNEIFAQAWDEIFLNDAPVQETLDRAAEEATALLQE